MIDEIFDRHLREGRGELNATLMNGFRRLSNAFGNAFAVLNRIEYSAPWAPTSRRARSN